MMDYTNFIKIGRQRFEVESGKKGKKTAVLPYEKLREAVSSLDMTSIQKYRGLKGKVLFKGSEILRGMNLDRILRIAPKLSFAKNIIEKWPKGAHFEYICGIPTRLSDSSPTCCSPARSINQRADLASSPCSQTATVRTGLAHMAIFYRHLKNPFQASNPSSMKM